MNGKNHIVKKQLFNVEIKTAKDTKTVQDEVSRISRFRLQTILDRILSKYDRADQVIRLDRVVLNCEYQHIDQLEKKLTEAVEKQLPEFFRINSTNVGTSNTSIQQQSPNHSAAQLLHHFLSKGVFPWWADSKVQNIEIIVETLLADRAEILWTLLKKECENDLAIRRFCLQINAKLLKKIKEKLFQQEYQKANRLHKKLLQFFQTTFRGKMSTDILHSIFQKQLLTYALLYRNEPFQKQKYLQHSLQALAKQDKVKFELWIKPFLKTKKGKGKTSALIELLKKEIPAV